jgi:outer membrane protein assembly factor BamB
MVFLPAMGLPLALAAANWPQWRGPEASGVSPETNLPVEWSATRNVAWKTRIQGRGNSSPVVWGDRLFLTTAIEGEKLPGAAAPKHILEGQEFVHPDSIGSDRSHKLLVICLDKTTGKVLWERTAYEGRVYDDRHKKGSYASPTPVTDGNLVYAYFGSEGLYAYTLDGKPAWKLSPGKLGTLGMGPGTSPVLGAGLLFLQCDVEEGDASFLLAVDQKTGVERWRAARPARATWSTPLLRNGQLIASAAEFVIAYDAATGKELWRQKGVVGNGIPSPVAGANMVYVSAGYPDKRAFGLKLSEGGAVAWSYSKGTAYVPSPILYGDYLYLMTDRGLLTCLDAKSGAVQYEGARVPAPATFTASPVAYEGKLLLTSEDGDTYVIKAGPKHEVLGKNSLGESVYASPAVADGVLYLRGVEHVYAIRR